MSGAGMVVGIVGSRTFGDVSLVRGVIANLPEGTEVVTGGARGVDRWAEEFAKECGLPVVVYAPEIDRHGSPAAFHIRNRQIADHLRRAKGDGKAVVLYAFSPYPMTAGTASTFRACEERKIPRIHIEGIRDGALVLHEYAEGAVE